MSIKKLVGISVALGALLVSVGCGNKGYSRASTNTDDTYAQGLGEGVRFRGKDLTPEEARHLATKRLVHFGFDKYDLATEDEKVILAHAKKLLENPSLRVRISGHTDDIGSREYNVALGQRRADSVARLLEAHGVSPNRVAAVSYGKEQPISLGNDDNARALNRRAEIDYEG